MALRRGDDFSAQGLADMQALNRRLAALSAALEYRLELVEEDE